MLDEGFMPQEESKSRNGTETQVAGELPSVQDGNSTDAPPGLAQGVASVGPAPSDARRSKIPPWALKAGVGIVALAAALYVAIPEAIRAFNTISTDDAYVNGHVTFVAARVPGQVMKVMVDDNNMVHKGDLLVELDKEPYRGEIK